MFTIIDTETSGLFDFSRPADAEGQPRLASYAAIRLDAELIQINEFSALAKPDGWSMDAGAAAVNGLTTERLEAEGIPISEILAHYQTAIEAGDTIVAFNAQFDSKVMRGEMRRARLDDLYLLTKTICVMRPLTDVCMVPKKSGRGFKFPKLSEALAHFKIEQKDAHTALADAQAAAELFRRARAIGLCLQPDALKQQPAAA